MFFDRRGQPLPLEFSDFRSIEARAAPAIWRIFAARFNRQDAADAKFSTVALGAAADRRASALDRPALRSDGGERPVRYAEREEFV
jgi:hypothetical protein